MDWHPYALIALGILVVLLQQSVFRVGSLRQALAAVTAGEPLAGIAFGIVAFGDELRTAPGALAVEAAGVAAMVVGGYIVATSAPLMPCADTGEIDRMSPTTGKTGTFCQRVRFSQRMALAAAVLAAKHPVRAAAARA